MFLSLLLLLQEYFPVPGAPLALNPSSYSASVIRSLSLKKALRNHKEESMKSLQPLHPDRKIQPFSRFNKGPGKSSKEASRRASTAPTLSSTAPGRYYTAVSNSKPHFCCPSHNPLTSTALPVAPLHTPPSHKAFS